jgi:hypothetical protein
MMMNLASVLDGHELARQADRCRELGSPFVAAVLDAADRQLDAAPVTAAMVRNWPGDPASAAVALRLNGALHALARRGEPAALAALYRHEHDDFDGAVRQALREQDAFIAGWMRHPTQTNEVARAAATMAALMAAPIARPMPFDLLELGASCGLNLNLARYAYQLGPVTAGDQASLVRIQPTWRGWPPPQVPVEIASARGVDLAPLDAANPAHRERLLSYIWADQPRRSLRLQHALGIAMAHPPAVEHGEALEWLTERLAEPQAEGHCRTVVHTMVLQYLDLAERQEIAAAMAEAGARATPERPLMRIGFEWTPDRREVELRISWWPTGRTAVLARCHPYGDWIDWLGPLDA